MMGTTLSAHVDSTEEVGYPLPLPRLRWFHWPLIVLNEIYKGILLRWTYPFELLTELITFTFIFVGFSFLNRVGNLTPQAMAPALVGYVVWFYLMQITSSMNFHLRDEAQTGTLEQMYMSPAPTGLIQIGRSLSTLLVESVIAALIVIPLILLFQIHIPFRWSSLPIFLLTLLGVYGFAFVLGGITLLFKSVADLIAIIQILLLFLNGAIVPVHRLPDWLAALAQTLPTTQGILVLRKVVFDGTSLAALWRDGSLVWLFIHSALYFALGWLAFSFCERKAKQKGILGHY